MPKIVEVEGVGEIEFSDTATDAEIIAFIQDKVGLSDDQLIAAAESPDNNYFERIGRDRALREYERYRQLKKDDTTSWGEAYDMGAQALGMMRDDAIAAYKELNKEDYSYGKLARSLFEGIVLRGTMDSVRAITPAILPSTWFGAEDTYEEYLESNGLEPSVEARANYLESLKGDFADFMYLRDWDVDRQKLREGKDTYIQRLGLDTYIGSDVLKATTEAGSYADPSLFAGAAVAPLKAGSKVATAASKTVGAAGSAGTLGGKGLKAVGAAPELAAGAAVGAVAGKEAGEAATKSVASGTLGATIAGGPTAPLTAFKAAGEGVATAGELVSAAAETIGKTPLPGGGVFEQIARGQKNAPLRVIAAASQALGGSTAARVAGASGKGLLAGGVTGAALGSIEALREKHFLETAVPGLMMGGAMGAVGGGGTQAFREAAGFEYKAQVKRNTQDWLAGKSDNEIELLRKRGLTEKDYDKLALIERVVAGVGGDDITFQYLNDAEFKALSGQSAEGIFMHQGVNGRPTVAINMEKATGGPVAREAGKPRAQRTIFHEVGHALDALDFAPEAKRQLNDTLFGRYTADGAEITKGVISDSMIDDIADQYGLSNIDLTGDDAIDKMRKRDLVQKEIRAEAWANMLEGKSIRKLGRNGWISRIIDGAVTRDADSRLNAFFQRMVPSERTGAEGLFTIGEKPFYNSPEMNKLLTSMFRAKRRTYQRLDLDVDQKRNVITQKDFTNPETRDALLDTFRDSDVFERNEEGQILNQNLQPISTNGGMPKFLTSRQKTQARKVRSEKIQEALMNAGEPPAMGRLGRSAFRFFTDPVARQYFRANGLGAYLSDSQMAALRALPKNVLTPSLLTKIEKLNAAAKDGTGRQFAFMYNAALSDTGRYSSRLSNEYRQGIVLDFEITTAGNFNIRTLDTIALFNRVDKISKKRKNDDAFWAPWGGYDKAFGGEATFMEGFKKYLDNHRAHSMGDETRQGWMGLNSDTVKAKAMRDLYNEVIGWRGREESNPLFGTLFTERDNPIKSRRLDRINEIVELPHTPDFFINPSLQRENFMPIKGAEQLLKHSRAGLKAGDHYIGVAPLRHQSIEDVNNRKLFDNVKYERLKTNAKNVAEVLGLSIVEEHDVFGGWNEEGRHSRETSYRVKVNSKDADKIEAYAALVGALAPEVQDAVMVVKKSNVKDSTGVEMSIPVRSKAKGQEFSEKLAEFGFPGYSYDPKTKKFILAIEHAQAESLEALLQFGIDNKLINEKRIETEPIQVSFPGGDSYKQTYQKIRSQIERYTKRGDDLNVLLSEAERQIADREVNEKVKALAADTLAQLTEPVESAVRFLEGREQAPDLGKGSKVRGVGKHFDKRALDMEYGDVALTPENRERMVTALAYETIFQLSQDGNALGWYDRAVKKAMSIIHNIHPELKTDDKADLVFKAVLAITSNGETVEKNFRNAHNVYSHWKEHGEVPQKAEYGTETEAINKSLIKFEEMLNDLGAEKTREFLSKKFSVGQLKKDHGFEISGENVQTMVPGAAIFGPKIGSFFNNLTGDYSTLTMDLWFSRTMNRIMGSMVRIATPEERAKRYERLRSAVEDYWEESGLGKEDTHNGYTKDQLIADETKLHDFALKQQKDFAKRSFKTPKGKPKMSELDKASNNYGNTLEVMMDAPRTGTERQFFRSVIQGVQDRLVELGMPVIEIADIQALLWYGEKDLFGAFDAVNKRSEGMDYTDASRSLARDLGVSPMQLLMPSAVPVPERFLGETPKDTNPFFQSAFDTKKYAPGGRYFDAVTKEDITGKSYAEGVISVAGGKPKMTLSQEEAQSIVGAKPKDKGKLARMNLFKQKAGWRWSENAPEEAPSTIVSVEQGPSHFYALEAKSEQPIDLATYPKKKSEPRLRPTTRGEIRKGNLAGEIIYQGKRRPVYDSVTIGQQSLMPGDSFYPTEKSGALEVFKNELGYRVTHTADGKYRLYDPKDALLGVAGSRKQIGQLYRRKVVSRRN